MSKPYSSGLMLAFQFALLGAVIYLAYETRRVEKLAREPHIILRPVKTPVSPPTFVTLVKTNDFRWAQLESEDYRAYIGRLRGIGCPEETIRDIIIADVEKLIAPRLHATRAPRRDKKYWEPDEKELDDPRAANETARQQLEIDFEKRDIIKELVGVDLVAERMKLQGEVDQLGARLGFLPEDQRVQLRKIIERYNHAEVMLREKAWTEGETITPKDELEIKTLQQKREKDVASLLSPQEWNQYELQASPTAYKVRDALFGMNSSEQEFQTVFQAQKTMDDKLQALDPSAPDSKAAADAAQQEFAASLRQSLGDVWYQDYLRSQDPDFRELTVAAVRNDVPRDKAADAYAIKNIALARYQDIATDLTLTLDQKTTIQTQIAQETQRTLGAILGDPAMRLFARRTHAAWLGL
jgi:hypothetical protein